MELLPVKLRLLTPPEDDLEAAIAASPLTLQEYDIVAIASKVVAIHEGRSVPRNGLKHKDELTIAESEWYLPREAVQGKAVMHSLTRGQLAVSAGIDPFGDYYVLWPEDPMASAERLRTWLKAHYGVENLGVVVTDSKSTPLRRGVVGGAIGWAGFSPLYDNRVRTDLMGTKTGGSQINIADSVAAAAVLAMGEGNEQTPLVVLRDVPYVQENYQARKEKHTSYEVAPEEDIFAPFFSSKNVPWQRGGRHD